MICITKREYETNVYHFAVDSVLELELLPKVNTCGKDILKTIGGCAIGSTAIVTETSDKYILNGKQNKWIKITSSSGGGGLPEGATIADDSEVLDLFS